MIKLSGKESLGIEFGSTRIKAVLIDESFNVVASGSHTWENKFKNGYWTYGREDIIIGMQSAYSDLNSSVFNLTGEYIHELSSIGISAMMHGYLPFDENGNQLCEFRTWRNVTTAQASEKLTELFKFNIPQRWSVAHFYQAVLNGEKHVKDISFLTTLAGYIHYLLSGEKVVGIGEASGMFPIDSKTKQYNSEMLLKFNSLEDIKNLGYKLEDVLPKVLAAGDCAGFLTQSGAALLDTSGNLKFGCIMCPPEGDAGTGMVATNSVLKTTGNVSAGTSIFSMIVLEKELSRVYEEIDLVTTPVGDPVAMVHCNNCCTDLDYWVKLFCEFSEISGANLPKHKIYDLLYESALNADCDCSELVSFNYFSGEPVAHLSDARPMVIRGRECNFNLSNFMRSLIYSTMATLKIGMEILEKENVNITKITGHGGLFKTEKVGQKLMAGALNTPVSVMDTAGEGGAWGIAVLASYAKNSYDMTLADFLEKIVFADAKSTVAYPEACDTDGFNEYMKRFKECLKLQNSAVSCI